MPYKETETQKVYWKIEEVAAMVHQATSALRFWEKEFDWLEPRKNKHGHRQYNREDVQKVLDINLLLNGMGMTIKGVNLAHAHDMIPDLKKLYAVKIRGDINYKN